MIRSRLAFENLPEFANFLAARHENMFKLRVDFEAAADAVHDEFMRGRNIDPERELKLHVAHMERSLGRSLESGERDDLESMLWLRGVAPLPESVTKAAAHRLGRLDAPNLSQIVTAFRGKRATMGGEGVGKAPLRSRAHGRSRVAETSCESVRCSDVCKAILSEHGYPTEVIAEALAACGPDLKATVAYCLQRASGEGASVPVPDSTHRVSSARASGQGASVPVPDSSMLDLCSILDLLYR